MVNSGGYSNAVESLGLNTDELFLNKNYSDKDFNWDEAKLVRIFLKNIAETIRIRSKWWYGLFGFVAVLGLGAILSGIGAIPFLILSSTLAYTIGGTLTTGSIAGAAVVCCKNSNANKKYTDYEPHDVSMKAIGDEKPEVRSSDLALGANSADKNAESKEQALRLTSCSQSLFGKSKTPLPRRDADLSSTHNKPDPRHGDLAGKCR